MNRKGFTLVELLAIIALISIITLIAIPSIRYANKKITNKNYETKKELIKAAAEEYGDDYKEEILNSSTSYNSYPSKTIHVSDLLQGGYLINDPNKDSVYDPRNDRDLKNEVIIIYIKNKSPHAVLQFTEES